MEHATGDRAGLDLAEVAAGAASSSLTGAHAVYGRAPPTPGALAEMQPLAGLPAAFVWSRLGTESGQSVDAILRRKNLERRASGMFTWGIGNALGGAVADLAARCAPSAPVVAFSPIAGRAAPHDTVPQRLFAWRSFIASDGAVHPLPAGSFVTSRGSSAAGVEKVRHYVLLCESDEVLRFEPRGSVDIGQLCNLQSGRAVGASQTTAVVHRAPENVPVRSYVVVLTAKLVSPYCAQLTDPVDVGAGVVAALQYVAESADVDAWQCAVRDALAAATPVRPRLL